MSRPRSAPIGWDSGRLGHCFRSVVPLRDTGTHLRMHQRLTPTLKREDTDKSHEGYQSCERILIKQKPTIKIFSCRVPLTQDEIQEITDRLYKFDPKYLPAESKRPLQKRAEKTSQPLPPPQVMLNKPIYSTEEVRAIVSRLQKGHKKGDKSGENSQNEIKVKERYAYYTAAEVQGIIDKVQYQPDDEEDQTKRVGSSRPCSFRSRSNSLVRSVKSAGARPSQEDIDGTTYRMTQPNKREPKRRRKKTAPESPRSKQVSSEELGAIVERLNTYNATRWPPESKPEARVKTPREDDTQENR